MTNKFIFVIDTDKYSGNFEREMTAYATGMVGDCGVGDEEAEKFRKDFGLEESYEGPFGNSLENRPDDEDGCRRPAAIWPSAEYFSNGMGGEYKSGEEEKALKDHNKAVRAYNKDHPTANLKETTKLKKYPAYMSVAIFFKKKPDPKQIKILKERTTKYAKDNDIKIFGHRILNESTTLKEI